MNFLSIEQASRATLVAFVADIPIAWWGAPGIGKSSAIFQLKNMLDQNEDEEPYEFFDLRLSDKEPSDIGGIPFPHEVITDADGKKSMRKVLQFLVMDLLPFDSKKRAIVLLDEFDRADLSVQNAALQLVLDRKVNGHKLSPNARIVLAGNSSTDIGTSPLSAAAANRMCHLYLDVATEGSLNSWLKWAEENEISPLLQGFAGYQLTTFAGGDAKTKKIEELAYATPRSFVYADRLLRACEQMPFDTEDIEPALVAGCVGKAAASTFLGYRDIFNKLPTMEQIIANPETVPLPRNPSVLFAHKKQLTIHAKNDLKVAEAVAKYALRWEKEPAADLFRMLEEANPEVVKTAPYKKWKGERDVPTATPSVAANAASAVVQHRAYCMSCKAQRNIVNPKIGTMPNGKPKVEGQCNKCGGAVVNLNVHGGTINNPKAPAASSTGIPILPEAAVQLIGQQLRAEFGYGVEVPPETVNNDPTYTNKIRVPSSGGLNKYTLSQRRDTGVWECSCKGFTMHAAHDCKHMKAFRAAVWDLTGRQKI